MKAAFVTDMHFGYRRFEEDALSQGREAILSAAREADILILGGDNFDVPLPRMETIAQVTGILREALAIFHGRGIAGTPIFALHGNHDRRAKGFVHPTELLAQGGFLQNFHNKTVVYEHNGERIALSGMGNVPDDLAHTALSQLSCKPVSGTFNIFVLHQSFKEFDVSGNERLISFDDLPEGYSLYLCGHVHKPSLAGKVLNPGSTVVTQLREDETGARGWLLYDTIAKKAEFKEINARKLFHETLNFNEATPTQIRAAAEQRAKELVLRAPSCLVKLILKGTIAKGFGTADLRIPPLAPNIFIDSSMESENFRERIEKIKQAREKKLGSYEQGMSLLRSKLEGTSYSLGDPEKTFAQLLAGTFLEETRKKIEGKPSS